MAKPKKLDVVAAERTRLNKDNKRKKNYYQINKVERVIYQREYREAQGCKPRTSRPTFS